MEQQFFISTDKGRLDLDFIHDYLSGESYWAKGRSKERVEKSIANSLCFGLFKDSRQIGFGRVATDYVVFAWIMDFFIDPDYRKQGLGKRMIQAMFDHPALLEVNSIGLRTQDAHALYKKFSFGSIPNPETWMLRKRDK